MSEDIMKMNLKKPFFDRYELEAVVQNIIEDISSYENKVNNYFYLVSK